MRNVTATIRLAALLALLLCSCATAHQPSEIAPHAKIDLPAEKSAQSAKSTSAAKIDLPAPPKKIDHPSEKELFHVSGEIYNEVFHEVRRIIQELDDIIQGRQFSAWLEYLSDDYRMRYNDPETLEVISGSRRLRAENIILKNIEDFFTHVVVPSRVHYRLDKLIFISEVDVEAIMIVNNESIVAYQLHFTNGYWKIIDNTI
ncbi:MAG: hypothetical protein ACR2PY_04805 [Salinispira sp.]